MVNLPVTNHTSGDEFVDSLLVRSKSTTTSSYPSELLKKRKAVFVGQVVEINSSEYIEELKTIQNAGRREIEG